MIQLKDRIYALLKHLDIEKAHIIAGGITSPIEQLSIDEPKLFISLTLVCPISINENLINKRDMPFAVVTGDSGDITDFVMRAVAGKEISEHIILKKYNPKVWSDIASERSEQLLFGIMDFLQNIDKMVKHKRVIGQIDQGEVKEINFRVQGEGPPLILFPLGLAASQWDPILGKLSEKYYTITVSGLHTEPTSLLEIRCGTIGYRRVLNSMLDECSLRPGLNILEIGCGTGAVARWLAEQTNRSNPITAVDINPFLLREAELLRERDKLTDIIDFKESDVHDLPFADNSFDVTFSTTVLEEVDADQAIEEMVRVTKPGGHIGSIVRAVDMAPIFGTELPEQIKTKAQSFVQSIGASTNGCADITLYQKFANAGLINLKMLPQFDLSGHQRPALVALAKSKLNESELKIWGDKVDSAIDAGFFFIGLPMHVVAGTKK